MNKSILITGCAGLIGSNLCDYILTHYPGYKVIGVDNLSDGYIDNVDDRVLLHYLDCGDDLRFIFENYDVEYVFHFAARAAESMSGFNRRHFHTNNVVNSANVINHCIDFKVKRLVFASSMAVYGDHVPPYNEDCVPRPIDPYGIEKYAVELDLNAAYLQHGLEYCIFRGHSIYGPKQSLWDKYRNVIGIWMRQILDGDPITIYGDGNQTRAFTYIDDILPQLWQMAVDDKCKNKTYNVGNDIPHDLLYVYKMLSSITGHDKVKFLPAIHEVPHAHCSHEKSRLDLVQSECTPLEVGLSKMWRWAKVQPTREIKIWDRFEIKQGLYNMWK